MNKVHNGIGDRLSTFIQWMTGFVGGVIAGFVYDWRLTLVMLGTTPFTMASVAFLNWVSTEGEQLMECVIKHSKVACTNVKSVIFKLCY